MSRASLSILLIANPSLHNPRLARYVAGPNNLEQRSDPVPAVSRQSSNRLIEETAK